MTDYSIRSCDQKESPSRVCSSISHFLSMVLNIAKCVEELEVINGDTAMHSFLTITEMTQKMVPMWI